MENSCQRLTCYNLGVDDGSGFKSSEGGGHVVKADSTTSPPPVDPADAARRARNMVDEIQRHSDVLGRLIQGRGGQETARRERHARILGRMQSSSERRVRPRLRPVSSASNSTNGARKTNKAKRKAIQLITTERGAMHMAHPGRRHFGSDAEGDRCSAMEQCEDPWRGEVESVNFFKNNCHSLQPCYNK